MERTDGSTAGQVIDRIAPTQRPQGSAAGYQRWRSLLFAHWPVPVEALRPLVPERLALDLYEGQALIGVVPFAMEGVRPRWAPRWSAFAFLETNVRAYVHLDGQPGVFFFSLEAASWIAVRAARTGWGLPYFHATMSLAQRGAQVDYETQRRGAPQASLRATWEVGEALGPSQPGTLEHFLLERYLLYVERSGVLRRGQVHHTPYPVHRARVLRFEDHLVEAIGLPGPPPGGPPITHCSPGVDVEVFPLRVV